MNQKFKGMGVALVTPFQENGTIDYAGLQRLIELQINNGTDFLVVHGTTGESVTLTKEEKRATLDFILEINNGRLPVVLGVGGNNTAEVVDTLKTFDFKGVSGILSASPAYNKPSQEGIYQHYQAIAENTDLPIILYNVPGRTASNMTATTTLRLANDFKNIVAIKEASGDMGQVMEIIKNKPKDFIVTSGDDALALPLMSVGTVGVISVVGQAFPKEFSDMCRLAAEGKFEEAQKLHYEILEITNWMFADGNPGGVKEVLKFMNICGSRVRLPLVNVNKEVSDKLYSLLANKMELTA